MACMVTLEAVGNMLVLLEVILEWEEDERRTWSH